MIPEAEVADAAARVLGALEGMSVDGLRALGTGLGFAGDQFELLAQTVDYFADVVEHGSSAELAQLSARVALKRGALDGELIDRLELAPSAFWRAVHEALVEIRAAGEDG